MMAHSNLITGWGSSSSDLVLRAVGPSSGLSLLISGKKGLYGEAKEHIEYYCRYGWKKEWSQTNFILSNTSVLPAVTKPQILNFFRKIVPTGAENNDLIYYGFIFFQFKKINN